jgi:hypothetical protein
MSLERGAGLLERPFGLEVAKGAPLDDDLDAAEPIQEPVEEACRLGHPQ